MVLIECWYYSILEKMANLERFAFFAKSPKIEIKQSKRPKKSNNQSHFAIPLSHPTPKRNQNNQNPGIIPGNIPHCVLVETGERFIALRRF